MVKKFVVEDISEDNKKIEFYSMSEASVFLNDIFWDDDDFDANLMTWKAVKESLEACDYIEFSDTLIEDDRES